MPDLTSYQIHELLMEAIGTDTPDMMPARIIVNAKWSKSSGIPPGQYSPAGENAMWIRTGDLPTPKPVEEEKHCCEMKRHYILGIVATNGPEPTEMVDFAVAWEPKILIAPKFCGWCGSKIESDHTRRITGL